jgi:hypothetical protein
LTEIDIVPGAVPDTGESPTQAQSAKAVHESVPPPPFAIEMLCAAGTALPAV